MARPRLTSGEVAAIAPLGAALPGQRTTALLKGRQLELIRLVLKAGDALPEHAAPGELTLQGVEGRLVLTTPAGRVEVSAGDLVHLAAGEPHAVHALEDASALITVCLVRGTPAAR